MDVRPVATKLLMNIKENLPQIMELQKLCGENGDDGIYRYYHTSFKVYGRLQPLAKKIVALLQKMKPEPARHLNPLFLDIIEDGTNRIFHLDNNQDWPKHTRPIVEAYLHSKWFLDQLVIASNLEYPPSYLPEGWASILTLYRIR
jgi:hypothetical protein